MNELDLLGLLERAYTSDADEPHFPVRGSAMGACPRRISMQLAGAERLELSAKAMRVFEDGSDRGRSLAVRLSKAWMAQSAISVSFVDLERSVWTHLPIKNPVEVISAAIKAYEGFKLDPSMRYDPIHGGLEIRSRCDVLLWDKAHKGVHLIEIKGKGSWGMKKLPEEGPGDEYLVQIWFQIEGLRREGIEVLSAQFLFENKDTQEWVPWTINLSQGPPKAYHAAIMHIGSVLEAFGSAGFSGEAGTPIHAFGVTGKLPWQCNYCSIGPIVGKCAPGKTVRDVRKAGASVPAWEVS